MAKPRYLDQNIGGVPSAELDNTDNKRPEIYEIPPEIGGVFEDEFGDIYLNTGLGPKRIAWGC